MPIDHKTSARNYPLPHVQNPGQDDVARLRAALESVDSDVDALIFTTDHLQVNKADQVIAADLQTQINNLSALVYASL